MPLSSPLPDFLTKNPILTPEMSAMRFNPICKAFAERLAAQGKPPIVIIGVIMNTRYAHIMFWKLIRFQFTAY
jgi:hypothetical protein